MILETSINGARIVSFRVILGIMSQMSKDYCSSILEKYVLIAKVFATNRSSVLLRSVESLSSF